MDDHLGGGMGAPTASETSDSSLCSLPIGSVHLLSGSPVEEAQVTDSASDDETATTNTSVSPSPISRTASANSISMTSCNTHAHNPAPVSISVALQQCRTSSSNSIGVSSLARPLANSLSVRAATSTTSAAAAAANHSSSTAAMPMTSLRATKSSCGNSSNNNNDVHSRFQLYPTASGDVNGASGSPRSPPVNLSLMDHPSSSNQGPISASASGRGGGCMVKCVSPAKNLAPRNRSHQHQNAVANRNGTGTLLSSSSCHNHLEAATVNTLSNSRNTSPRSSTTAINNNINNNNSNNHQQTSNVATANSNGGSGSFCLARSGGTVATANQNQIIPVVYSTAAAANQNVPFFTNLSMQSSPPPQPLDDAINSMTSLSPDVQLISSSSSGGTSGLQFTSSNNSGRANAGTNRSPCSASSRGSSSSIVSSSPSSCTAPHNWQSMKMSMRERLAFLFNNEIMSDVKFIVGRGASQQRIPAHKFILSIGSAVFNAMFNGSMATTDTEIELPDVEPVAFMFLLKFLYTDEAHIGPETVMTTLYTAKKYAVPALESQCVEFLKRNLNAENAFMLLSQARLFDEQQLGDLCLETIDKNTTEAISAEGFVDIDLHTLSSVLKRDTLSIRECKLFQAIVRWADAECQRQQIASTAENKRRVLGDATDLIRYPLMSMEEFASCAQTKILQDREIVNLFLYFTVNPKPNIDFFDKPRCYLSGVEYTLNRFRQVDCRWGYSGTPDKIRFRVNQKIHIVGLALYGSTHLPTEYQVSLQVVEDESGKVCGDNDTSFSSDGSSTTFRVMFREPVEVRPHNYYTASATIAGADSHYGTKGMRKVHVDTPDGKIVFHFQHSPGNNNGTSVEDGQIPQFIFYT